MNRNIQMDKKKLNRDNRNLKDFSPTNIYKRIRPNNANEYNSNNNRSKSRNSSDIIYNNTKNSSNLNLSKGKM